MTSDRITRLRKSLELLFPERHLYIRSHGELRAIALTPRRQMGIAAGVAAIGVWLGVTTTAMLVTTLRPDPVEAAVSRERAKAERWVADREARLNSAVIQLSDKNGSVDALASQVESRHAALAQLVGGLQGQGGQIGASSLTAAPLDRIRAVRLDQDRLITQAETYAKSRADRLRLALRLAGLNPASYSGGSTALGGPLIEAKDPRALAAVLDVDEDFARRIQRAANDMSALEAMTATVHGLPLARPTGTERSSGYGVRFDPFTRVPAFHPGLDFSGAVMTPIHATAPGVVSFTGVRSGYGNTVEIDHGRGFKTRYAHLQAISVTPGQPITLGQRLGAMGSTGRSTGPHLHYEVWVNGRSQNPERFLRAGAYVQQTSD